MTHDHLERHETLGEFLLRVQDSSFELNDWLDVNNSRDVKCQIEQTRIDHVLEDEGDLEVAEIVQEGQHVHDLDHEVFIRVDLLGHFELHCAVSEGNQKTDGHLLSELLMLLDQHQSHDDEDSVRLDLTERRHVSLAFCGRLLCVLARDEHLRLVVDLAPRRDREHLKNRHHCIVRQLVDLALLFGVFTLGLKLYARLVLGLSLCNLDIVCISGQVDLAVNVGRPLRRILLHVSDDEGERNHEHDEDAALVRAPAELLDRLERHLDHHHAHHRRTIFAGKRVENTAAWGNESCGIVCHAKFSLFCFDFNQIYYNL